MASSADDLEKRHGCMLRQPPYNAQTSWYQMKNALAARRPPIKVSTQVMRSWWDTYRGEAGESSQSSSSMTAIQLQYQYLYMYICTYICIGALMYLRSFGEKSLYIYVASIHSMVMVAVMSRFIGLGRPSLHEYVVS
jgi:hypothetical protein